MDSIPSSPLPAIAPPATGPAPPHPPVLPERSDFLDGDAPAAERVAAFLTQDLEARDGSAMIAGAPRWIHPLIGREAGHTCAASCATAGNLAIGRVPSAIP